MFRSLKNSKGMTLIEIVIVVAILGGLMAVLVTQVQKRAGKARIGQTKLAMGGIDGALQMYYTDCNKFPADLNGLIQKDECSNWGPESYLKSKKDILDAWGNQFDYAAQGSRYTIKSLGADGQEGGSGNDQDITNEEE
jgi:general secretion pathway protein G